LIVNNNESDILFLFNLPLVYIKLTDDSILLTLDNVYLQVSTVMALKHLTKRLLVLTNVADWKARHLAFYYIPKHLHLWYSKSLNNFVATAFRIEMMEL